MNSFYESVDIKYAKTVSTSKWSVFSKLCVCDNFRKRSERANEQMFFFVSTIAFEIDK